MVLPGNEAKKTRIQFKEIIEMYMTGKLSLLDDIQANAASTSPVAELARESLKRKREEAEIHRLEIENNKAKITFFLDTMELLDPEWRRDTRLLMQTKDLLKDATFSSALQHDKVVTIDNIALDLGYGKLDHAQSCLVGKRASQLYQERHGAKPVQREQFVEGCPRMVNHYTEHDRDLIEEALGVLDD